MCKETSVKGQLAYICLVSAYMTADQSYIISPTHLYNFCKIKCSYEKIEMELFPNYLKRCSNIRALLNLT